MIVLKNDWRGSLSVFVICRWSGCLKCLVVSNLRMKESRDRGVARTWMVVWEVSMPGVYPCLVEYLSSHRSARSR